MAPRYVARQPIVDHALMVVGYELLYRTRPTGPAAVTDDDVAPFSVLYAALVDLGLESTVQQARAWVNVSPRGQALRTTPEHEAAAHDDRDDAVVDAHLTAVRHADERWDAIAGC